MFATRAAARVSLRPTTFNRGIHSAIRGNWPRSSAATVGLVVAAAGSAFATYASYKSGSGARKASLDEAHRQRQTPIKSEHPSLKSQDNTSVDSSAHAKSIASQPGVLEPEKEPSAPTSDSDSNTGGTDPDQMDELEADAAKQGAFNPETGEINWDCPCLGGMAHGPCGHQFRDAFSCFVYSEQEPKGVDCVEKFKAMQDCFREHPDVYGEEIDDDENSESPDKTKSEGSKPEDDKPQSKPEDDESRNSRPGDEKPLGGNSTVDKPRGDESDSDDKSDEKLPSQPAAKSKPEPPSDTPAPPAKETESQGNAPTTGASSAKAPTKSSTKH